MMVRQRKRTGNSTRSSLHLWCFDVMMASIILVLFAGVCVATSGHASVECSSRTIPPLFMLRPATTTSRLAAAAKGDRGQCSAHHLLPFSSLRNDRGGRWSQQEKQQESSSSSSSLISTRTTTLVLLHAATRPQDNLVAGMSEISFAFSLGVLWSEYCIIMTGCGPTHFSDTLERICYQGVLVSAGIALFLRIVTGGAPLEETADSIILNNDGVPLAESTRIQVRIAEWSSALAVLGAIVALGYQTYVRGANMEGLSGIDVSMCRAIQSL